MRRVSAVFAAVIGIALASSRAGAEPMFLSRQYARCTTCHYSPTGGGLLTPYGRSLSREELSTFGRSASGATPDPHGEQGFLWGALGDRLGPLSLGFDTRPSHLSIGSPVNLDDNFLMNADLVAAIRSHGWTAYGELGREPTVDLKGTKIQSYEYWIAHDSEGGIGFRAGRFMPAYGIRLADHIAYTRLPLGFDALDQVFGLEVSRTTDHHLLQVSVGPGRADSVLDDDGRRAFTTSGRFQLDLSPRTVLVLSGLYRGTSRLVERNGAGGVALGFAPVKRVSIWTEGDVQVQRGAGGAAYVLLNETSLEVVRGMWLKVSPQFRTDFGGTSPRFLRLALEADLFPRTHWNVDVSSYWDKDRRSELTVRTFLAQLHLYL